VALLRQLVAQHGAVALAVGLPLDLEGMEGSAVATVRSYAQQLTKTKNVRPLPFYLA
jgi:RNase H-fold protein (predicted Holliday junction resolvase)